jgi:hypothetical protein
MRDFKKESMIHSETLGFDLSTLEQGTSNWHKSRAGVITASKAYILLMEDKIAPFPDEVEIKAISKGVNSVTFEGEEFTGTKSACTSFVRGKLPRIKSDTKMAYMDELIASIATGLIPDEIKAKPLQWGKDNEEAARDAYSARTFETIEEQGFIYKDATMRCGASPDGLITGKPKGLELKAPYNSGVFIAFAARDVIKQPEIIQCQYSMWVTGYDSWGFAKFDPRNINCKKLHIVDVVRDEVMIKKLEDGARSFISEMDEALKKLGMSFGMQWN